MSASGGYVARLHALIDHSEAVATAADSGDWDALLAALEKRQAVMVEVDGQPMALSELPINQKDMARQLLERVITLDQDVSRKVNIALANTRSAMDEARLASTTVSAYRKTMNPGAQSWPARFVDRQK